MPTTGTGIPLPLWAVQGVYAKDIPRDDTVMSRRDKTWLPGGNFKFKVANFTGSAATGRDGFSLYGVDGVNPAFVFDGTSTQFIETGVAITGFKDNPNSLAVLPSQMLALGYNEGTVMLSSVGDPTQFSVAAGAAEIAVSDPVVDLMVQPAGNLAIFCNSSVKILSGKTVNDFELTTFSERLAATTNSIQPLGDTVFLSDDGLNRLARVDEFGDYRDAPLSEKIKPLLDKLKRHVMCSWMVASNNEYRIMFRGGLGVIMKCDGPSVVGFSTFDYKVPLSCAWSSEAETEQEYIYAGSAETGYVYRLEHGDSFDGQKIESVMSTAFNFGGSVEQRKRFKKVMLELDTSESAQLQVRAELDYASPEAPPLYPHEIKYDGGGGFYDLSYFQSILWSEGHQNPTDAYVIGVGRNLSLAVYSEHDEEPPHRLSAYILHWSMRGRRR